MDFDLVGNEENKGKSNGHSSGVLTPCGQTLQSVMSEDEFEESPSVSCGLFDETSPYLINGNGVKRRLKRPLAAAVLMTNGVTPCHSKRKSSSQSNVSDHSLKPSTSSNAPSFQRSFSETEVLIMNAVQRSDQDPDLIGDFSKSFALPLIQGKHQDLKTISPSSLASLLRGEFDDLINHCTIVDCRYPYEFVGGHIKGAVNLYTREAILGAFFNENSSSDISQKRHILVFHCEFSSERGPTMYRFTRQKDRELNTQSYPRLLHPEIYLLHGGYKAFFESYKDLCEPGGYVPMHTQEHKADMRLFRSKSKSWTCERKWSGFGSNRASKF